MHILFLLSIFLFSSEILFAQLDEMKAIKFGEKISSIKLDPPKKMNTESFPQKIQRYYKKDFDWKLYSTSQLIYNNTSILDKVITINHPTTIRTQINYLNGNKVSSDSAELIGTEWKIIYLDTVIYDEYENIVLIDEIIHHNHNKWEYDSIVFSYNYDNKGRIIFQNEMNYNTTLNSFSQQFISVEYDDVGSEVVRKHWRVFTSGKETDSAFYDEKGLLDSVITTKENDNFFSKERYRFKYDGFAKLTFAEFHMQNNGDSIYELVSNVNFHYDNYERLVLKEYYKYLPIVRTVSYNYFENGGYEVDHKYGSNWDQFKILYNQFGYPIYSHFITWLNGDWSGTGSTEHEYIFDDKDRLIEDIIASTNNQGIYMQNQKIVYSDFFEDEVYNLNPYILYPNPTNSFFKIAVHASYFPIQIKIYDITGRLVLSQNIDQSIPIDISNFQRGTYIVEIENGTERIFKKLIKM